MEQLKFIGIPDLMRDIGLGIGTASKELVYASSTKVGTLAIKSADVTVSLELTSAFTRREDGISVLGAGAKTLSLSSDTSKETQNNRCTITLSIVSVIPPDARQSQGEEAKPLKLPDSGLVPIDRQVFLNSLRRMRQIVYQLQLSPQLAQAITQDINKIEKMAKAEKIDDARAALVQFSDKYSSTLNLES